MMAPKVYELKEKHFVLENSAKSVIRSKCMCIESNHGTKGVEVVDDGAKGHIKSK